MIMEVKEITIKTDKRIVNLTDNVITIRDLQGFLLTKITPDKIQVKKEIKILMI